MDTNTKQGGIKGYKLIYQKPLDKKTTAALHTLAGHGLGSINKHSIMLSIKLDSNIKTHTRRRNVVVQRETEIS